MEHHRNLADELVKGIAATGGVVGVNFFPGFIDPERPTVDRIVDHIEHLISLAGADHVGLGPDFVRELFEELYADQPDLRVMGLDPRATIEGLEGPNDLPVLTEVMLSRGLPEPVVRKLLGDNFLRVFREVMGVPGGSPA